MTKFKLQAHSELAQRRFKERARVEAIEDQLLKDELYRSLHSERVDLRANIARLVSQNQDTSAQKERYEEIVRQMDTRLEELGYEKEELEIDYVCPLCKDTGFVDGKECNCLKQLVYARLRAYCGSLPTEEGDFSKIDMDFYPAESKDEYKVFYRFLEMVSERFPNNNGKIIGVFGPVGVGKTYGVSVLANNLMKKGFSVLSLNSAEMNSLFLKYHLAKEVDKADIWEPLADCDMLILDDLGAEPLINNVTKNYLLCLLHERQEKTTCFTSNLSPEALREKYDDRIFSRISHKKRARIFVLSGKDLRFN